MRVQKKVSLSFSHFNVITMLLQSKDGKRDLDVIYLQAEFNIWSLSTFPRDVLLRILNQERIADISLDIAFKCSCLNLSPLKCFSPCFLTVLYLPFSCFLSLTPNVGTLRPEPQSPDSRMPVPAVRSRSQPWTHPSQQQLMARI